MGGGFLCFFEALYCKLKGQRYINWHFLYSRQALNNTHLQKFIFLQNIEIDGETWK